MENNIPIYRAEIDCDLSVVAGWLCEFIDGKWYAVGNHDPKIRNDKIIPSINMYDAKTNSFLDFYVKENTLSIHFSDMIDSQGNKIFASLQEDGKGGDILHKNGIGFMEDINEQGTAIVINGNSYIKYKDDKELLSLQVFYTIHKAVSSLKIIGIKE